MPPGNPARHGPAMIEAMTAFETATPRFQSVAAQATRGAGTILKFSQFTNFNAIQDGYEPPQGAIMDNFLSLSISLGIAAFGLWGMVTVESLPCTILAPLPIIVGLISLYGAVREAKAGHNNTLPRQDSSPRRPF